MTNRRFFQKCYSTRYLNEHVEVLKMKKFSIFLFLFLVLTMVRFSPVESQEAVSTLIRTIDFADDNIGYAVGEAGIILKTTDGGNNWNIIEWQYAGDVYTGLRDVCCVSENETWVVGYTYQPEIYGGFIMHTSNGGETWEMQYTREEWTIEAIDMWNSTVGWAVGSYNFAGYGRETFYRWNGTHWWLHYQYPQAGWTLFDVCTLNSTQPTPTQQPYWAYACGSEGRVWYCWMDDWYFNILPTGGMLKSIHFINETHGWTIDQLNGRVFATESGAHNWHEVARIDGNPLSDIKFYNATLGWLCSAQGQIWNTTDCGETWNMEMSIDPPVNHTWRNSVWYTLCITHSEPKVWVGGATSAWAFGESVGLTTIMHKSSPWKLQLSPTMKYEIEYNQSLYTVLLEANSTLTNFGYIVENDTIVFKVFGPNGHIGKCRVTIPKELVSGYINAEIDFTIIDATVTSNSTHFFVDLTYTHSIHDVGVEMSSILFIPGDFDFDRDVDIYDIVNICNVYGLNSTDPEYDELYDVVFDGKIDIYDIVTVCNHYGETYP